MSDRGAEMSLHWDGRPDGGPPSGARLAMRYGTVLAYALALAGSMGWAGIDLRAQATTANFRTSKAVPTQWIRNGKNRGWRITSVTGAPDGWTVVMSRRSGYKFQTFRAAANWPTTYIDGAWRAGRSITEIAHRNGTWFVVTSSTRGFEDKGYVWSRSSSLVSTMEKYRREGDHVTDVAYGDGQWVVSLSNVAAFGHQVFTHSSTWPSEFISRYWREGYDITEAASDGDNWVVVMTNLTSGPGQSWGPWTGENRQESRREGRQILDLVYGDGYYRLITTGQLGEVMGFPPPSGGTLQATVRSNSARSATFTVDLFVVGSDSELLSLRPRDLTIRGFTSRGTRLSFTRSAVSRQRQRRVGPYSAMFLLDQSGSITGTDPLDARIDAAKVFMGNLASRDEVGLSAFATDGRLPYSPVTVYYARGNRRFTSNPRGFDGALSALADLEGGGTPLYDAARIAVNETRRHAGNRNRAVIVFTDGQDTASRSSLDAAIDYAKRQGVPLHTVALSEGVDIGVLSRMAGETGGSLTFARDARRLISYYGALGPYLSGAGQFYRTTWRVLARGGSFTFGRGQWIYAYVTVHIPGSTIALPFRLDFR